jgi:4-hydroxy-2-oxoheptanedioate aldolase
MGHLGNPQHEAVQAAIKDGIRRLNALGKPAGILSFRADEARKYIEWGFRFIAVGSDLGLLAGGSERLAASFKE